jgi:hypothetical protein
MSLGSLIVPLGISTYILLLVTIATGLLVFKFHVKWVKIKWHVWVGVLTLLLGTLHAGLVIYLSL